MIQCIQDKTPSGAHSWRVLGLDVRHVTTAVSVYSNFILADFLSFLLSLAEPKEEDGNQEDGDIDHASPPARQHTPAGCSAYGGGGDCGDGRPSSRQWARPVLYPKEKAEDTAPDPMEGLAATMVNVAHILLQPREQEEREVISRQSKLAAAQVQVVVTLDLPLV